MSYIDYMKVIDCAVMLFNADPSFDLKARHEKTDIFDITMTIPGEKTRSFRCTVSGNDIKLIMPLSLFDSNEDFRKWLSKFEYELEQTFFMNIRLDYTLTPFADSEACVISIGY